MVTGHGRQANATSHEPGSGKTKRRPMAMIPENRPRILLADHDALVRAALAEVLTSEGYAVDEATDQAEILAHASLRLPDLLLMDLDLPHAVAVETVGRRDGALPRFPLVVMTVRPNQHSVAARLGADALLEKPLDIPELLRTVRRLVAEPWAKRAVQSAS